MKKFNWEYFKGKYLKPASLAWWSAFVTLMVGLFIAAEPIHGSAAWAESLSTAAGDLPPSVLITTGLFGVGIRGAV